MSLSTLEQQRVRGLGVVRNEQKVYKPREVTPDTTTSP